MSYERGSMSFINKDASEKLPREDGSNGDSDPIDVFLQGLVFKEALLNEENGKPPLYVFPVEIGEQLLNPGRGSDLILKLAMWVYEKTEGKTASFAYLSRAGERIVRNVVRMMPQDVRNYYDNYGPDETYGRSPMLQAHLRQIDDSHHHINDPEMYHHKEVIMRLLTNMTGAFDRAVKERSQVALSRLEMGKPFILQALNKQILGEALAQTFTGSWETADQYDEGIRAYMDAAHAATGDGDLKTENLRVVAATKQQVVDKINSHLSEMEKPEDQRDQSKMIPQDCVLYEMLEHNAEYGWTRKQITDEFFTLMVAGVENMYQTTTNLEVNIFKDPQSWQKFVEGVRRVKEKNAKKNEEEDKDMGALPVSFPILMREPVMRELLDDLHEETTGWQTVQGAINPGKQAELPSISGELLPYDIMQTYVVALNYFWQFLVQKGVLDEKSSQFDPLSEGWRKCTGTPYAKRGPVEASYYLVEYADEQDAVINIVGDVSPKQYDHGIANYLPVSVVMNPA